MSHYFKIIVLTSDKNKLVWHNYFLIEHNYSQSVTYNFKPELKFCKNYSVVKITILVI